MVRLDVVFSQLIFDHALRVRVNTASAGLDKKKGGKDNEKGKGKDDKKKDDAPRTNGSTANGSQSASSSTTIAPSEADSTKVKKDSKAEASKPLSPSNQAGSISNLLTVDVRNILEATDL